MSDPAIPTVFESPTGAKLALYRMAAQGEPRGAVHINHGLAEHAARYGPFADFLASRGYHVYAQDHRGHGQTTAPDAPARQFGGWNKVMEDVAAVNAAIREASPGLPVIIFGHSLGGIVALNHLMRAPETVDGAAIWNSNASLGPLTLAMKGLLGVEGLVGGKGQPSGLMNALTFAEWNKRFKPNRTDFDWLSRNHEAVDAYVADPLCGWPASIALWRDFVAGIEYAQSTAPLKKIPDALPIQLVGGGQDPATDNGKAIEKLSLRMKDAGLENVQTAIFPDSRHETLNDLDREEAFSLFADWADRATAARQA